MRGLPYRKHKYYTCELLGEVCMQVPLEQGDASIPDCKNCLVYQEYKVKKEEK